MFAPTTQFTNDTLHITYLLYILMYKLRNILAYIPSDINCDTRYYCKLKSCITWEQSCGRYTNILKE